MRGKAEPMQIVMDLIRITPAYAGKRVAYTSTIKCLKDHPRLCGEKLHSTFVIRSKRGSPPPMRGKGFDAYRVGVRTGITPAYAGKSGNSGVGIFDIEDHPRLCGEK